MRYTTKLIEPLAPSDYWCVDGPSGSFKGTLFWCSDYWRLSNGYVNRIHLKSWIFYCDIWKQVELGGIWWKIGCSIWTKPVPPQRVSQRRLWQFQFQEICGRIFSDDNEHRVLRIWIFFYLCIHFTWLTIEKGGHVSVPCNQCDH